MNAFCFFQSTIYDQTSVTCTIYYEFWCQPLFNPPGVVLYDLVRPEPAVRPQCVRRQASVRQASGLSAQCEDKAKS